MGNSRILILVGGSHLQLPLMARAKRLGLKCAVIDDNPDSPAARAATYCAAADLTDFSSVVKAAKRYKAAGCITMDESTVATVCRLNEKLGLPIQGKGIGLAATDKHRMRERFVQGHVHCPEFIKLEGLRHLPEGKAWVAQRLGKFAIIAKPSDRSGSVGTSVIRRIEQYDSFVLKAFQCARNGKILLERYMEGKEYGAQTLSVDGEMKLCVISRKTISANLKTIGHDLSDEWPDHVKNAIRSECVKALHSLGVVNGPSTIDIRMDRDNRPVILEVGLRVGGTRLPRLISAFCGLNMLDLSVLLAAGRRPIDVAITKRVPAAVLLLHFDTPGTISDIHYSQQRTGRFDPLAYKIKVKPGTRIDPNEFYGYVLCTGRHAMERCRGFMKEVKKGCRFG